MTRDRAHGPSLTLTCLFAATLVVAPVVGARGQADTTRADSTRAALPARMACDSVLLAARVDSQMTPVRAYLSRTDGRALPAGVRFEVMQLVLSYLDLPRPMQLPVFAPGPARTRMLRPEHLEGEGPSLRTPVLYGVYGIFIRRADKERPTHLDSVRVDVPTYVPGFDSSIVRAVRHAVADPAIAPMLRDVRDLRDDSMPLRLGITSGAQTGGVRVPPVTLFTAAFPRLRLTDAHQAPGNIPPEYPMIERIDGDDGEVLIRVVIGANGRALIPSAEVLHTTSPLFSIAALGALAQYRFIPAQVGDCAVPQVLEVPFFFSLRP